MQRLQTFLLFLSRCNSLSFYFSFDVLTALRYAGVVFAVALCLSVCLSQAGVLLTRLSILSHKQRQTTAQRFKFSGAKDLDEIPMGPSSSSPTI